MLQSYLDSTRKSVTELGVFMADTPEGDAKETLRGIRAQGEEICAVIERAKVAEGRAEVPDIATLGANVAKFNGAVSRFLSKARQL